MNTQVFKTARVKNFSVVEVDIADIEQLGEEEVWNILDNSEWAVKQERPLVIVYLDDQGDVRLYGDEDGVAVLSEMDYEDIRWGKEVEVEWPEYNDGYAVMTHSAVILKGYALVEVNQRDVELLGEEEAWEVVADSEWVAEHGKPLVIAYVDDNDEVRLYGDDKGVQTLAKLDYNAINWTDEIEVHWPVGEENIWEGYPAGVLDDEDLTFVQVDVEDIEEYGEETAWDIVSQHEWVRERGRPLVIVYEDYKGRWHAYGETDGRVGRVSTDLIEDVNWDREIFIEWPDSPPPADHNPTGLDLPRI